MNVSKAIYAALSNIVWRILARKKFSDDELGADGKGFTDLVLKEVNQTILPFGAGRRGCPGSAMAIVSVEFSLAHLVHTFDWRVEGHPSQLDMTEACVTMMPRQAPLFAYPTMRLPP